MMVPAIILYIVLMGKSQNKPNETICDLTKPAAPGASKPINRKEKYEYNISLLFDRIF